MDFIVDNYFWFIVGGVVVLMIIIGYIAEQTDFGRKPLRKKKSNNAVEVSDSDNKEVDEATAETIETEEILESAEAIPNEIVVEGGNTDMELPEDVVDEDGLDSFEQVDTEETVVEDAVEEPTEKDITDIDIPEVASEAAEDEPAVSETVEEVIADDSEDDVWKF